MLHDGAVKNLVQNDQLVWLKLLKFLDIFTWELLSQVIICGVKGLWLRIHFKFLPRLILRPHLTGNIAHSHGGLRDHCLALRGKVRAEDLLDRELLSARSFHRGIQHVRYWGSAVRWVWNRHLLVWALCLIIIVLSDHKLWISRRVIFATLQERLEGLRARSRPWQLFMIVVNCGVALEQWIAASICKFRSRHLRLSGVCHLAWVWKIKNGCSFGFQSRVEHRNIASIDLRVADREARLVYLVR